jgi:uncharacterized glyoxalase superfamily protein PhnB
MRDILPLLIVDDLQATIDYYIHKLGFGMQEVSLEEGAPRFAIMKRKAARVMLESREAYAHHNSPEWITGPRGIGVELHMVVSDGVDALHAELAVLDVDIIKPIHTNQYGVRHFSIRDLNGYILTFKQ